MFCETWLEFLNLTIAHESENYFWNFPQDVCSLTLLRSFWVSIIEYSLFFFPNYISIFTQTEM